jgi:Zn-dependent M16 (insulinase) family peptidase
MKTYDTISGFRILRTEDLPEYRSRGILAEHIKTGCLVYHIANNDTENLFAFAFPTPPGDSTGVPHILEHTVLCGSERYPIKDPFLTLLRGSMYTFLNAMTYPDRTIYPAGSVVEKDFFNLLSVYGDAVFFPLLKKEAFRQEGHRIEETEEGSLQRVGIVYNEMKGEYSSENSLAGDSSFRSLFSGESPYKHDSGGDPEVIPHLTYEEFKAFHKRYYHPSNCRIVLYGNIPTEKTLAFLEKEFLSGFERGFTAPPIHDQEPWTEPRFVEKSWPCTAGEETTGKTTLSVNWLSVPVTDGFAVLAWHTLAEILLGHPGSPLAKAIVESGLGEDLSPVSGLETDLSRLTFSVGLRGTDPGKRDDFVALVTKTLTELAEKGIDHDAVESSLRQVEFRFREIKGGTPFGLRLIQRMLKGWIHGGDPTVSLNFEADMKTLREKAASGRFFENLIGTALIENTHRSIVTLKPDPEMEVRTKQRETDEMAKLAGTLTAADRTYMKEENLKLKAFQEEPDNEANLACIPFLTRSDIPEKIETIPSELHSVGGCETRLYEMFTNGVCYFDCVFDIGMLEKDSLFLLPLLCRALTGTGLPGKPYEKVMEEIALKTGGFGADTDTVTPLNAEGLSTGVRNGTFFIRMKMLTSRIGEAIDLLGDLLLAADFNDADRLEDLTLELRNDIKSGIIPSGNQFAALRAGSRFSDSTAVFESWHGISQLLYLNDWCDRKKFPAGELASLLDKTRKQIFNRRGLKFCLTAEAPSFGEMLKHAGHLAERIPPVPARLMPEDKDPAADALFRHPFREEALLVPAGVSYIACIIPGATWGTPGYARELLLAHLLRTGWLWEQVRMKGGAYGASASNSGLEKYFIFSSYRDPNIVPTLEAFRGGLEHFSKQVTDQELLLALIGVVGKELRPMTPPERGIMAFKWDRYGMTDELRQKKREMILSTTAADLKETAAGLLSAWDDRSVTVIGGKDPVAKSLAALPGLKENRIELPI